MAAPLYLGFDFSTQQLKVVCIDESLVITHEYSVEFDRDLPEFRTNGGVNKHNDGLTVTAPTIMWVKALDVLLDLMRDDGFPFNRVSSLSGCGQQHGSVYWRTGSEKSLQNLTKEKPLHVQLKDCFSVSESPVWMDHSTGRQCAGLESSCGGGQTLTDKTGSRAYERFTGNQIAKLHQQGRLVDTERISLVSSFGASLFLGCYGNIDLSDGSGMNVLDINTHTWWSTAMEACAPNLDKLLGPPVPSNTVLGRVSSYFVAKYGFSEDCSVVAFTGDNPSSLAGMRLQPGDVVVSLGTSDTLFMWIEHPRPQLMGHVFVNPVDKSAYMAMLCYKNGSRTRERIRDESGVKSWEEFKTILDTSPPGNNGHIGVYFTEPEITPSGLGMLRADSTGTQCASFPVATELRALVEGQFLAKLNHATTLGYQITSSTRVLATGGAASNDKILQIIADVFNSEVYVIDGTVNSACLGGAYRARHALMGGKFSDSVRSAQPYTLKAKPRTEFHKVYSAMLESYAKLESSIPRPN